MGLLELINFKGGSVTILYLPSKKEFTVKEKNLLPLGVISPLRLDSFLEGAWLQKSKQEVAKVICVKKGENNSFFFQRQLSRIEFPLNYPPIRNNFHCKILYVCK